MVPTVQYTRSGDVTIAYQVVGEGAMDLVVGLPHISHLEVAWEGAEYAHLFDRLGSFSRLLLFDKRGVGMSERLPGPATLEERADDIRAVMDACGSERAVIVGLSESGAMSVVFAASHPARTAALVTYGAPPCGGWHADDPVVVRDWPTRETYRRHVEIELDEMLRDWGQTQAHTGLVSEQRADEARVANWLMRMECMGASPSSAAALFRMNEGLDVREVLSTVGVPTLVLHREKDSVVPVEYGRYLAQHIPDAKYVELPGEDHLPSVTDMDLLVDEIEEFVTGFRRGPDPDRVLMTVLFTDIVNSTARAVELGDNEWMRMLERHHGIIRATLQRYGGREVDTAGDGFFAVFDGPARAVRCALEATRAVRSIGLEIRAGVHTGECEVTDDGVRGLAVHVGARVASLGAAGDVLVTDTVKDLVTGSGLRFESAGRHSLKGVPGDRMIYHALG
jgi:class 3 adenylate cyclase